jgi:hypothetical protein
MRAKLQPGRVSDAVLPCGARIVVTVFSTVANARVVDMEVAVRVFLANGTELANAVVRTNAQGEFSVEIGDIETAQTPELLAVEVDARNGEGAERALYEAVGKRQTVEGSVYIDAVYELDVVYRCASDGSDDDGRRVPGRAGKYSFAQRWYEDDSVLAAGDGADEHNLYVHDGHSLVNTAELEPSRDCSKPEDYATRNWTRHIRPTLRFEARVKKKRGLAYLPIATGEIAVEWETVDPQGDYVAEGRAMNPARPVTWLRQFFANPNVRGVFTSSTGVAGGYNCPEKYGGLRSNAGGVPTRRVLFAAAEQAELAAGSIASNARSAHTRTSMDEWCSEVLFCPELIGGDRYFFVASLCKPNGDRLRCNSSQGRQRVSVHTRTLTLWREISISQMFRLGGVETDFNWELVCGAYEAAYIKVDKPRAAVDVNGYTVRETITNLFNEKNIYLSWMGHADEAILLPAGLMRSQVSALMETLTKRIITKLSQTCRLPDPNASDAQETGGHDFWMLCCKDISPDTNLAGMYIGNGQFFMSFMDDYTETFVHELGHALYLRHGLTGHSCHRRPSGVWDSPALVSVVPPENLYDHDLGDAVSCVMSYGNACFDKEQNRREHGVEWHFCAVCLLKLRFWNTASLNKEDWFRNLLLDDLLRTPPDPVVALDDADEQCRNPECHDCARIVWPAAYGGQVGEYLPLTTLVRPEAAANEMGEISWVNLRGAPGYELTSSAADVGEVTPGGWLELKSVGQTTVTSRLAGRTLGTFDVAVLAAPHVPWQVHTRKIFINPFAGVPPGPEAREFLCNYTEELQMHVCINGTRFFHLKAGTMNAVSSDTLTHLGHDRAEWTSSIDGTEFVSIRTDGTGDETRSAFLACMDGDAAFEVRLAAAPVLVVPLLAAVVDGGGGD